MQGFSQLFLGVAAVAALIALLAGAAFPRRRLKMIGACVLATIAGVFARMMLGSGADVVTAAWVAFFIATLCTPLIILAVLVGAAGAKFVRRRA